MSGGGNPLGPGAEFDAIRAMLRRLGPLATGVGDDAAVLSVTRGDSMVASVDALVENRHFQRGWLTPREIGRRAVVAAMSDLAAMAARPAGVLLALVIPNGWRAELDELTDGFGDALSECGTVLLGGNMSDGGELSITTTVLGAAFAPLARSGARPGDTVYLTGRLGAPGAALERLYHGEPAGPFRDGFARPHARLAEARWVAERGATAAIDISDGLVSDLGHLAAASGARIELDAGLVPCFPSVTVEAALTSGEEYELVVTSSAPFDTGAFSDRFGIPLTEVGRVVAGAPRADVSGARVAAISGHDHFSQ